MCFHYNIDWKKAWEYWNMIEINFQLARRTWARNHDRLRRWRHLTVLWRTRRHRGHRRCPTSSTRPKYWLSDNWWPVTGNRQPSCCALLTSSNSCSSSSIPPTAVNSSIKNCFVAINFLLFDRVLLIPYCPQCWAPFNIFNTVNFVIVILCNCNASLRSKDFLCK